MELLELIKSTGGVSAIAREVGLSEAQAAQGAAALLPGLVQGFQRQAASAGVGGLLSMLGGAGGGGLLDNVLSPAPTDTSLGNNVLGQLLGSKDVSRSLAAQAAQATGIDAGTLQKILPMLAMLASGLLAKQGAGASAGGGLGGLAAMLPSLLGTSASGAGAGGLAAGLGKMLDGNNDGSPLDDIAGLAGKFFGK